MIASRLPTMKEAVEVVTACFDRQGQQSQLAYMRETQSDEFARQVHDKVKAAGGLKKK